MDKNKAEYEIAKILQQLEKDEDRIVDAVEIKDVEITKIGDARPQYLRRVLITTHRIPGSNWG